jgi:hypothetical protein
MIDETMWQLEGGVLRQKHAVGVTSGQPLSGPVRTKLFRSAHYKTAWGNWTSWYQPVSIDFTAKKLYSKGLLLDLLSA